VVIKVDLVFFIVAASSSWSRRTFAVALAGFDDILFGAGVLFIGYEGFGLVTNAAGDMANPKKQLPASALRRDRRRHRHLMCRLDRRHWHLGIPELLGPRTTPRRSSQAVPRQQASR